jgi:hypothetical protein
MRVIRIVINIVRKLRLPADTAAETALDRNTVVPAASLPAHDRLQGPSSERGFARIESGSC